VDGSVIFSILPSFLLLQSALNALPLIFVIHSQNTTSSIGLQLKALVTVVTDHGILNIHDILFPPNAPSSTIVSEFGNSNSHSIICPLNA
jgi:hypothetical protein